MEEATACALRRIGGIDGSLRITRPDEREPQVRASGADDSGFSQDEQISLEETEWLALRHMDVWEPDIIHAESIRSLDEQTDAPGSARKETEEKCFTRTVGQKEVQALMNTRHTESTLDMLPSGTSIDVGACIVLADLAFHPRLTLDEWFGPYINIRRALPMSRGYVVIPKLECMCARGVPHPFLEVRRMVSQRPVKLQSVLVVFGRNNPASRAILPNFSEIVQGSCSAFGRRILQRDQQTPILWLGFCGFWWNFGVQGDGQEVDVLLFQLHAWIDIDDAASFYRLQQLASEIDEAFPVYKDAEVDDVLLLVSRGKHGIVPSTCKDPVALKAKLEANTATVLGSRMPQRIPYGPITLPAYWIYAAAAEWIGGVVSPKQKRPQAEVEQPEKRVRSESSVPFCLVESSSESDDEPCKTEDAFDVKVLTEWNRNAYGRQSLRNLRQLAQLTKAL